MSKNEKKMIEEQEKGIRLGQEGNEKSPVSRPVLIDTAEGSIGIHSDEEGQESIYPIAV
ncbi:hypothetical protein GF340_04365 [Candidatus Peregrinibacteria bacterium]|nr:hypothetical protein [Candidatus Peregrinibacteria bacterium]